MSEEDAAAAREALAAMRRRRLLRIAVYVAAALVTAGLFFGVRALLHDSPCVELLDAAERKTPKGLVREDRLVEDTCRATLSDEAKTPKVRIFASTAHRYEQAAASLRMMQLVGFEELTLGDRGVMGFADDKSRVTRQPPKPDTPTWLAPETFMGGQPPAFHVAVVEEQDALLTVELDAAAFDRDEALAFVESMKSAVRSLRRLRHR